MEETIIDGNDMEIISVNTREKIISVHQPITFQVLYSLLKEMWVCHTTLCKLHFPMLHQYNRDYLEINYDYTKVTWIFTGGWKVDKRHEKNLNEGAWKYRVDKVRKSSGPVFLGYVRSLPGIFSSRVRYTDDYNDGKVDGVIDITPEWRWA